MLKPNWRELLSRKPVIIKEARKSFLFFKLVNMFRFAINFPDLFATRNSIVYLFFLFKQAQGNRKAFFDLFCLICFVRGIETRYWRSNFNRYWDHNFLYFPSYYYAHLYYFEYWLLNMSPQKLSYDNFYYGHKDPYMALNYKDFFFKASFHMFITVWKAMAHLRATCYSHYVRSHFAISHPIYRHARFALTRQWTLYFVGARLLAVRQISRRFLLDIFRKNYHVYIGSFIKAYVPESSIDFPWAPSPQNDNFIRFLTKLARIPSKLFKSLRFLRLGVHQWLGLLANSIMARYPNHFVQYTRLDYEHGPIMFKILSFTSYSRNRLLSMWLGEWKAELFAKFFTQNNFFRLFTVLDFLLMNKRWTHEYEWKKFFPWVNPPGFYFNSRLTELSINDDLEVNFFSFFSLGRMRDTGQPLLGDNWPYYEPYWKRYLINYGFFGKFHSVDPFMVKKPLYRVYHQWRIFNLYSVCDFLQGRLPLRFLYRRVELDYLIGYRYRWAWNIFKKELPPKFFHTFCKPKFKLRKRFDTSRFVATPFPERHLRRAFLKQWYKEFGHKPVKPKISLKLTSLMAFSMMASVFVELFYRSLALSFLLFFTLWNWHAGAFHINWSIWQSGTITSLFVNQRAVQCWLRNYKDKWPHYRRKISKSGIHSLTNSFFRENWIRIFHKCRRSGFKKHELPYYCYDESLDLIDDLTNLIRNDYNTIFDIPGVLLIEEDPGISGVFNYDVKKNSN